MTSSLSEDLDSRGSGKPNGPFWTRHLRREVQYLLDILVLIAAFALAYALRFDFSVPPEYRLRALLQLPFVVLLQFAVIHLLGTYRFVWRYVGMSEIETFVRGAFYSGVPLLVLRLGLPEAYEHWRIPLSVIVLDQVLAFGGLLGLRVLRRALYERFERIRQKSQEGPQRRKPIILVGAGRAGVMVVREIRGRGDLDLDLVGFVDDDPLKKGSIIQGVEVLGTVRDLPRLAEELNIDHAVITIAEADSQTIRGIVEICERARIPVRIIPGLYEILRGRISISRFRELRIDDLLGRAQVKLDESELRRFLAGKSVMVTGAGGSIGSELCRQVARFNPSELLLVERAEGALFEIDRELRELWPQSQIGALLADIGDERRMRALIERHRPNVILHSAAHKHVPMMERHPSEAIRNNVLATRCLGHIAGELGVEAFVLISTDKAVRPSSIMGASKRVAELVIQALDQSFPGTRFVAVRFGNVLGSAGSVVPIFREQIERGGPVTITHPEVTRYFMTIPEAAQLVLEAGSIGKGGEIMILDMGEPIRILDLAKDMIALSGLKPFEEMPITFTGLRPGEKLFEELELESDHIDRTRHPKIFVGRLSPPVNSEFEPLVELLVAAAQAEDEAELRRLLSECLPESELKTADATHLPADLSSGSELLH